MPRPLIVPRCRSSFPRRTALDDRSAPPRRVGRADDPRRADARSVKRRWRRGDHPNEVWTPDGRRNAEREPRPPQRVTAPTPRQTRTGVNRSQTRWLPRTWCSSAKTAAALAAVTTPGLSGSTPDSSRACTPAPQARRPSRAGTTPGAAAPRAGPDRVPTSHRLAVAGREGVRTWRRPARHEHRVELDGPGGPEGPLHAIPLGSLPRPGRPPAAPCRPPSPRRPPPRPPPGRRPGPRRCR